MIPKHLQILVQQGQTELKVERRKRRKELFDHFFEHNHQHSFYFQASRALGILTEYAIWPKVLTPAKDVYFLSIRVPDCSPIIALFRRIRGRWCLEKWGITCYEEKTHYWVSYYFGEKSTSYLLALAHEQYLAHTETKILVAEVMIEDIGDQITS